MQICRLSKETLDTLNLKYGQVVEVSTPNFNTICEVRSHDAEFDTQDILISGCAFKSDLGLLNIENAFLKEYSLKVVSKTIVPGINVIVYVNDDYFSKNDRNKGQHMSYYCKQLLQGKLISKGVLFRFNGSKIASKVKIKAIEITSISKDAWCCSGTSSCSVNIDKIVQYQYIHQRNEFKCRHICSSSLKMLSKTLQFDEKLEGEIPSILVWGPSGSGKATLINMLAQELGALIVNLDANKLHSQSEETISLLKFQLAQTANTKNNCFLVLRRVDKFLNQPSNSSALSLIDCLLNICPEHLSGKIYIFVTANNLSDVQLNFREKIFVGLPSCDERQEYFYEFLTEELQYQGNNDEISKELASCTEGQNWKNINKFIKSILRKKLEAIESGINFSISAEDFLSHPGLRKPKEVHVAHEDVPPVLGCKESKQQLMQTIFWPKLHMEALNRMSLAPDRAVLLYGEPGCGKTSLVRMLAHQSKMTLFSISAADIYSPYFGDSEKQLNDIFAQAKASSPSILFFDEIDCLAGNRKCMENNSVQNRVACALFLCMDSIGCSDHNLQVMSESRVVVIATTNDLAAIDPSLRRRFDKIIKVELPDADDRLEILKQYTSKLPLHPHVDLEKLSRITTNFSGADLECLCKRVFQHSMRISKGMSDVVVEECHFEEALKEIKRNSKNFDLHI